MVKQAVVMQMVMVGLLTSIHEMLTTSSDANGLPKSRIPRLPHSLPSFDLRSNAVTPGKNGTPAIRKASDGPLGLTRKS